MPDEPRFSLRHVSAFLKVVELGSVRAAAQALDKDASAVSRAISALEQECGATLLKRSGRGVTTTDIGELVASFGRRQLAQQSQLAEQIRNIQAAATGHVELVAGEGFVNWLAHVALPELMRQKPGITINLTIAGSDVITSQIADERADLGLIFVAPKNEWIRSHATFTVNIQALVHRDHPLARLERPLTLADLRPHPGILLQDQLGVRQIIRMAEVSEGVELRAILTTNSFHAMHQFAIEGLGYALTTTSTFRQSNPHEAMVFLPMNNPVLAQGSVHLISKHGRTLSPAALAISNAIARHFPEIAERPL